MKSLGYQKDPVNHCLFFSEIFLIDCRNVYRQVLEMFLLLGNVNNSPRLLHQTCTAVDSMRVFATPATYAQG